MKRHESKTADEEKKSDPCSGRHYGVCGYGDGINNNNNLLAVKEEEEGERKLFKGTLGWARATETTKTFLAFHVHVHVHTYPWGKGVRIEPS